MKTFILALAMSICFLVGLVCLHLILNRQAWLKQHAKAKPKQSKKPVCKCPTSLCRLLYEKGKLRPGVVVLIPLVLLLTILIMSWLAFEWQT